MQDNSYALSANAAAPNSVPPCFLLRETGVFVDTQQLDSPLPLLNAVNQLFSSGYFFGELDYDAFLQLLYEFDKLRLETQSNPLIRLATAIELFTPERHALYRGVKIEPTQAEYYFEPVFIERTTMNGRSLEPTSLNFDEFVAYLWEKGVRYGIDAPVVRAAIKLNKPARHVVAKRKAADPGLDAGIQELAAEIHRSDAPREKSNGRLDLAQFKNRFPQVKKGVRLLKKVPRSFGAIGYELNGDIIEPGNPKDCDLSSLIGPGTELVKTTEGEFIVSTEDGFLNLDPETNKISIGKKIINHDGVSGRTTGNLKLNAGDFEEFGEVQEKRIVEGNNITIHGVVFGNILSRGGTIILHNNLMGGTVTNRNGDIHLKGIASSATVQVLDGVAYIQRAEGCILLGKKLHIEHASNCEIVAEEVSIKNAEGCVIAAKVFHIDSTAPRKQSEMQLLVLVPETEKFDLAVKALREKIQEHEQQIANKKVLADEIPERPDVKKYIAIATKVKNKEVVLTSEQVAAVQKLAQKIAPDLKLAAKLDAEIKDIQANIADTAQQIEQSLQQKEQTLAQIHCQVKSVAGDTQLRQMRYNPDADALYTLPAKEVKTKLRATATNGKIVLSALTGSIDWKLNQNDA